MSNNIYLPIGGPYLVVCKEFEFDAAHQLKGYAGPCGNLHGHRWKLQIEFIGKVNPMTAMMVDFTAIKKVIQQEIITRLDHQFLNEIVEYPTAENIIIYLIPLILSIVKNHPDFRHTQLKKIRLYETPTSYCEWNANESI